MKLKFLILFLSCFSIQFNFAAEAQISLTTEKIEEFAREGREHGFGWCECEACLKELRIATIKCIVENSVSHFSKIKKTDIVYTSFASGYKLLQDFVTLRALQLAGFESVTLYCIDPCFEEIGNPKIDTPVQTLVDVLHPFVKGTCCFPYAKTYLTCPNSLPTDILTTIGITDFRILEDYVDIADKKTKHGISICSYSQKIQEIEDRRKQQSIRESFTQEINF